MTCKDQKLRTTHLFKKKRQKILHKIINKAHSKSFRLHDDYFSDFDITKQDKSHV